MRQKIIAYLLTFFIRSGTFAIFAMISRIQKPMADDLHFTQQYLGMISFFIYFGRTLGSFILFIYPQRQLKHTTIISTIFFSIFFLFLPIAGFIKLTPKLLIGIGSIAIGFSRAYTATTYLLLRQVIGQTPFQKKMITIWYSGSYFGDIIGILAAQLMLQYFNLNWETTMILSSIILLIICLMSHIYIQDTIITQNEARDTNVIIDFFSYCKTYFSSIPRLLFLLSYIGLNFVYFIILMWLPYFFQTIGFIKSASYISIILPVAYVVGNILYQYLVSNVCRLNFIGYLNLILLAVNGIMSYILTTLRNDPQEIVIYCVIFAILGLFFANPEARLLSTQIDFHADNSSQRIRLIYLIQIFQMITSALLFLLSGYILQSNIYSLFYLLAGICTFNLIVYALRVIFYPIQFYNDSHGEQLNQMQQ